MKTTNNLLSTALILASALFITSCSIENKGFTQRRYTKGVYAEKQSKVEKPASIAIESKNSVTEVLLNSSIEKNTKTENNITTENTKSNTIPVSHRNKKKVATKIKQEIKTVAQNLNTEAKSISISQTKGIAVQKTDNPEVAADQVLEIICAIILPPLGVYLHENQIGTNFWISLLLTILLFWLPGVIFSVLVVLDVI